MRVAPRACKALNLLSTWKSGHLCCGSSKDYHLRVQIRFGALLMRTGGRSNV